ncbi:hypothetical protein GGI07_005838 [Coemansia sp. Benny D115]|nr:hypothetical protein GGI07_005838 [Coemansia sp. Benny D115]
MTFIKELDSLLSDPESVRTQSKCEAKSLFDMALRIDYADSKCKPDAGQPPSAQTGIGDHGASTTLGQLQVELETPLASQPFNSSAVCPNLQIAYGSIDDIISSAIGITSRSNSALAADLNPNSEQTTKAQKLIMSYTEKEKLKRRYECGFCSKRFPRPSALRSHEYTHTGERPFVCEFPGCTRSFSVLSNLRRHLIVHTRSRGRGRRGRGVKHLEGQEVASRVLGPAINASTITGMSFGIGVDGVGRLPAVQERTNTAGMSVSDYGQRLAIFGRQETDHPFASSAGRSNTSAQRVASTVFTNASQMPSTSFPTNVYPTVAGLPIFTNDHPAVDTGAIPLSFPTASVYQPKFLSNIPPLNPNPSTACNASIAETSPTSCLSGSVDSNAFSGSGSSTTSRPILPYQHQASLAPSSGIFGPGDLVSALPTESNSSSAMTDAEFSALLRDIPLAGQQPDRRTSSASVSSSDSDTGSESALRLSATWLPPNTEAAAAASNFEGGSVGVSSNDIQQALSDIFGNNVSTSLRRPEVMTNVGSSVTTKAMGSAIEYLSTHDSQQTSPPVYPTELSKHSLHNRSIAPGLPGCIGRVGGMVAATKETSPNSVNGLDISNILNGLEKAQSNCSSTGNVNSGGEDVSLRPLPPPLPPPPTAASGMSNQMWLFLQSSQQQEQLYRTNFVNTC